MTHTAGRDPAWGHGPGAGRGGQAHRETPETPQGRLGRDSLETTPAWAGTMWGRLETPGEGPQGQWDRHSHGHTPTGTVGESQGHPHRDTLKTHGGTLTLGDRHLQRDTHPKGPGPRVGSVRVSVCLQPGGACTAGASVAAGKWVRLRRVQAVAWAVAPWLPSHLLAAKGAGHPQRGVTRQAMAVVSPGPAVAGAAQCTAAGACARPPCGSGCRTAGKLSVHPPVHPHSEVCMPRCPPATRAQRQCHQYFKRSRR